MNLIREIDLREDSNIGTWKENKNSGDERIVEIRRDNLIFPLRNMVAEDTIAGTLAELWGQEPVAFFRIRAYLLLRLSVKRRISVCLLTSFERVGGIWILWILLLTS